MECCGGLCLSHLESKLCRFYGAYPYRPYRCAVFKDGALYRSCTRNLVIPEPETAEAVTHAHCRAGKQPLMDDAARAGEKPCCRPRNYSWAELMRRVFSVDVLRCERCGGRMRIIAAIHPPEAIRKILECLGLPSRPPPLARPERIGDPDHA